MVAWNKLFCQNDTEATVSHLLGAAKKFLQKYNDNPSINVTYGYFICHPFSTLNKLRLKRLASLTDHNSNNLRHPLRILDLACGGGLITSTLAAAGHNCLGIDANPEEIKLATRFCIENQVKANFLSTDLLSDPKWELTAEEILNGKPDLVILAYALHHFSNPSLIISRLGRWIESPCLIVINEENPSSPIFKIKHLLRGWIQNDTYTEWHRPILEWKEMLKTNGFTVSDELIGLDLFPLLGRIKPSRCWSVIFLAKRI